MAWEIVFMLLILKIPIIYLCAVLWWAIKAEPSPPDLAGVAVLSETPPPGGSRRREGTRRRRPLRPHTPGLGSTALPFPQRGGVRA